MISCPTWICSYLVNKFSTKFIDNNKQFIIKQFNIQKKLIISHLFFIVKLNILRLYSLNHIFTNQRVMSIRINFTWEKKPNYRIAKSHSHSVNKNIARHSKASVKCNSNWGNCLPEKGKWRIVLRIKFLWKLIIQINKMQILFTYF